MKTVNQHRRRAGFTLMEVMVAVGLMTVGALAIMAMQQAATRGNMEARQIGTATEITSRWVERLRRDALAWNRIGTTAADLGDGGVLAAMAGVAGGAQTTGWFQAPSPANIGPAFPGNIGPAFDWTGLPIPLPPAGSATGPVPYCTYLRLTWVRQGSLMRADVLTWWHRRGAGGAANISDLTLFPRCGAGATAGVITNLASPATVLRSVQGSTLLRWTQRAR